MSPGPSLVGGSGTQLLQLMVCPKVIIKTLNRGRRVTIQKASLILKIRSFLYNVSNFKIFLMVKHILFIGRNSFGFGQPWAALSFILFYSRAKDNS